MANTPDPQPLDLDKVREIWATATELRADRIIADLVAEVERLRAENARLRQWGGMR
jgi:hypothetical protein